MERSRDAIKVTGRIEAPQSLHPPAAVALPSHPLDPVRAPGEGEGEGEDEPDLPVPMDAFQDPLDQEFSQIGLDAAPPDPFKTEFDRRFHFRRAERQPAEPMPLPDVALIRRRMRMSQQRFALIFGFPLATLRHWEKGDRHPSGAALVLLNVIARHPRVVLQSVARYRMWRVEQRIRLRQGAA